MKIFISWSGERSQVLAQALRDWLPLVLHYVEPWLSEADVAAGDRWAQEVAKELEASNFGIICVTPENVAAPWVLFEAGALAKSMQGARVVPLLYGLEFSDISGPLAQFQAKKVETLGLGEVIQSINHATAEEAIPDDRAKQLFAALWPEFENRLKSIPDEAPTEKHMRPQHEILEEMVAGVRGLDARFRDLENSMSDEGALSRRRRLRHFHPRMFEELMHMSGERDDPLAILMAASFVRDDMPWLYELAMEVYRAVKAGNVETIERESKRVRRFSEMMMRGPFMEEFGISSKEGHMFLMEFPRILEHMLRRTLESEKRTSLSRRKQKPQKKPDADE